MDTAITSILLAGLFCLLLVLGIRYFIKFWFFIMSKFNIYLMIVVGTLTLITLSLLIHDFIEDSAKKSAKK